MNPVTDPTVELERLVGHVLKDLPARSAPAMLENRVLAAIAQRAALPWWRHSFLHWPMAARLVFLVASVGFVKFGLSLSELVTAALVGTKIAAVAPGIAWMRTAIDLSVSLGEIWRALSATLPLLWVYASGGVLFMLYMLFFGITALGYRALQAVR